MTDTTLTELVQDELENLKAQDIKTIDVSELTTVTDTMIIASGTSDRHTKAIAQSITERAKKAGYQPIGIEGQGDGEWILVDLGDLIVHIMLPRTRDFYNLERLWSHPDLQRTRA